MEGAIFNGMAEKHKYVPSAINTERGKFCRICSHRPNAEIHNMSTKTPVTGERTPARMMADEANRL